MAARTRRRPTPPWLVKTLKVVRRVHLYLGLVLLPFALFFGASGVLFNHPGIGSNGTVRTLDAETRTAAGVDAWDPEELAGRIVEELNAQGGAYRVDPSEPGRIVGPSVFLGRQADGSGLVAALQLDGGGVRITERPAAPRPQTPAFAGEVVEIEGRSIAAMQEQIASLLESEGYDVQLRAHPRPPAQLRFAVLDENGDRWNVVWNSGTGELDAIHVDESRGTLVEFFKRLHLRHHYPASGGVAWVWALFADLTGLAMVAWSLTGLVMWWQLRKTRALGTVFMVVAVTVGLIVFLGMAAELGFIAYGKPTP